MKLAMENYVLRCRYGDEKAIKMIKEAGFDAIDYSFYWTDENTDMLSDDYKQKALEVKKILEDSKMCCVQAHAPFDLKYENTLEESDILYKRLVRSLEFASILGANAIIVHRISTPDEVDSYAYNQKFFKSLEPYCEKYKIHIAVENLFARSSIYQSYLEEKCVRNAFGKPEYLKEFINDLNSKWFVACIDIGHAALTGNEPEDFISKMDNRMLKALHVQDNDYLGDKHMIPYSGKLNWDNITKALAKIGYNSDFTLEIVAALRSYDDDLIPEALKFAAKIGRYLINKIEKAR